jgi:hypothetical protein
MPIERTDCKSSEVREQNARPGGFGSATGEPIRQRIALIELTCIPGLRVSLAHGYLKAFAESLPELQDRIDITVHCVYVGLDAEEMAAL